MVSFKQDPGIFLHFKNLIINNFEVKEKANGEIFYVGSFLITNNLWVKAGFFSEAALKLEAYFKPLKIDLEDYNLKFEGINGFTKPNEYVNDRTGEVIKNIIFYVHEFNSSITPIAKKKLLETLNNNMEKDEYALSLKINFASEEELSDFIKDRNQWQKAQPNNRVSSVINWLNDIVALDPDSFFKKHNKKRLEIANNLLNSLKVNVNREDFKPYVEIW